MIKKRKILTEKERNKILKGGKSKYQDMPCKVCGRMQYDVPGDVVAITCWLCVAKDVGFPEEETNKPAKSMGWHLRKVFVDENGTVYHKGVEQPELHGTLPVSEVKTPKKREKKKSMDDMVEEQFDKITKKRNKKTEESEIA